MIWTVGVRRLVDVRFDFVVDISEEMLYIASEKARAAQLDKRILFLNQDMTEFELYGTVDAAVCALDGVNYLTENIAQLMPRVYVKNKKSVRVEIVMHQAK